MTWLRELWRLWFSAPESVQEHRIRVLYPEMWKRRQAKVKGR